LKDLVPEFYVDTPVVVSTLPEPSPLDSGAAPFPAPQPN
jgi:hypothetical protein